MSAAVPPALFDEDSVQKYILISVSLGGATLLLVRGSAAAEYHNDVLEAASPAILAALPGAAIAVLGGGRLAHDGPRANSLRLYGYSVAFGRAEHAVAAGIIEAAMPHLKVTWSNDGY